MESSGPGPWPGGTPPVPSAAPTPPAPAPDGARMPWRVFQEVKALRAEVRSLRAEQEEAKGRLDKLYEVVHGLRADRTTELESAHHETSQAYSALRDRIIGHCRAAAEAAAEQPHHRAEAHVRLSAALFRTVLGEHPAAEEDWHRTAAGVLGAQVPLGPVTDLHRHTAELRARIAELGGVHRWNFELRLGHVPDPRLHEVWPRSDEHEPLSLCVAPAYQVVGRPPHVRPLVHTVIGRV